MNWWWIITASRTIYAQNQLSKLSIIYGLEPAAQVPVERTPPSAPSGRDVFLSLHLFFLLSWIIISIAQSGVQGKQEGSDRVLVWQFYFIFNALQVSKVAFNKQIHLYVDSQSLVLVTGWPRLRAGCFAIGTIDVWVISVYSCYSHYFIGLWIHENLNGFASAALSL